MFMFPLKNLAHKGLNRTSTYIYMLQDLIGFLDIGQIHLTRWPLEESNELLERQSSS